MSIKTLEKGKPYLVNVSKVRPKEARPSYPKNGETWYNFLIDIELKDGSTGTVEYTSKRDVCEVFEIGIWQYIVCVQPNEKGCQVEPYDPEVGKVQAPPSVQYNDVAQSFASVPPSIYSVKVHGEAITFCMAWAKDLKVAEMALRPSGSQVTELDLADIGIWASAMCVQMSEHLKF